MSENLPLFSMLNMVEQGWDDEMSRLNGQERRNMEGFVEFLRRVESGEIELESKKPAVESPGTCGFESFSWDSVRERFAVGTPCVGKVTNVVDFGVFVEVLPGLSGLIHRSHINCGGRDNPYEFFSPGQIVDLLVSDIDDTKRHISFAYDASVGRMDNLLAMKKADVLVDADYILGALDLGFTGIVCLIMEVLSQHGIKAKLCLPRDVRPRMEKINDKTGLQFLEFLKTNKRDSFVVPQDGEDYSDALFRYANAGGLHIISRRFFREKAKKNPWLLNCTSGKRRLHPCMWSEKGVALPTVGLALSYGTQGGK